MVEWSPPELEQRRSWVVLGRKWVDGTNLFWPEVENGAAGSCVENDGGGSFFTVDGGKKMAGDGEREGQNGGKV
jgi:hypothetical protein